LTYTETTKQTNKQTNKQKLRNYTIQYQMTSLPGAVAKDDNHKR